MSWRPAEKKSGSIMEFQKVNDKESEKLANGWSQIRHAKPMDLNDLKPKYFEKEIPSYDAKIVHITQPTILELNRECEVSGKNLASGIETETEIETEIVANFTFEILERREKVYRDSISEHWLKILIFYKAKHLFFEIKVEDYKILSKEIRKVYPQCFIFQDEVFSRNAAELYGTACEKLRESRCYFFGGWYEVENRWKFLNHAMSNVETEVELCFDKNAASLFLTNFLSVSSEKDKLWILLFYALWAPLAKFYEKANIDGLRSVLYLSAPTGTGKTTVAKIFARALLPDDAKVELRFDDTKASLQESVVTRNDVICLVDDFYAKGSKNEDADFKSKASEITRIVGDGMVKGKMGANRKPLPDRKYRGGVIATGEFIDLNTHSSYLRCWLLNFPKDSIYFNKHMTFLQKNPKVAKSFLSQWIYFLENNQVELSKNLSVMHDEYLQQVRAKYFQSYPRFQSNSTTFLVITKIFTEFCRQNNFDIKEDVILKAIWNEAEEQLKLLKGISPEAVFKMAVAEAMDNAYLRIADNEDDFKKYDSDGFRMGQFLFIITAQLEKVIEKYADKNSYGVKFNEGLKHALSDKRVLLAESGIFNIRFSKNREVEPKRPRLYKINEMELGNDGK